MMTIKFIQRLREEYTPENLNQKPETPESNSYVDEVVLISAEYVYRKKVVVRWKNVQEWYDRNIGTGNGYTLFGDCPFSFSPEEREPKPDAMRYFDHITYRDSKNDYKIIIHSGGMVYVMNDAGQTVDSF